MFLNKGRVKSGSPKFPKYVRYFSRLWKRSIYRLLIDTTIDILNPEKKCMVHTTLEYMPSIWTLDPRAVLEYPICKLISSCNCLHGLGLFARWIACKENVPCNPQALNWQTLPRKNLKHFPWRPRPQNLHLHHQYQVELFNMSQSNNTCPQSGSNISHLTDIDKAPLPSISNDIWILSSDVICQLNQLFSNSEAAMLSSRTAPSTRLHKTRTFEGRV